MVIKKKILILILYFLTSCSSYDENKKINIELPQEVNTINEMYVAYIQIDEWEVLNKSRLENCKNLNLNLNLEKIYKKEVKKLLKQIFKNIDFNEYKLNLDEIKDKEYHGQIIISQNKAISDLQINKELASLKMNIQSKLLISNFEGKNFTSIIRANGFGSKELFFSCKVHNIIKKTLEETYEEFLNTLKNNIYKGLSEVNKKY